MIIKTKFHRCGSAKFGKSFKKWFPIVMVGKKVSMQTFVPAPTTRGLKGTFESNSAPIRDTIIVLNKAKQSLISFLYRIIIFGYKLSCFSGRMIFRSLFGVGLIGSTLPHFWNKIITKLIGDH